MLEVRGLEASYGRSRVLTGIDLEIGAGQVLTLVGRNGAGRSTLARALVGRVAVRGSIRFDGRELVGWPAHRIARAGIAYVPENREVFSQLEVEENLVLGRRAPPPGTSGSGAWDLEACYALFPRLAERRRALAAKLAAVVLDAAAALRARGGADAALALLGRALAAEPDSAALQAAVRDR